MRHRKLVQQKYSNTIVDCIKSLDVKGYKEDFKTKESGIQSLSAKKIYSPDEIKILSIYHFKGISDPADDSILYVIETADGRRGTLVDTSGPYPYSKAMLFMHEVEEIGRERELHQAV